MSGVQLHILHSLNPATGGPAESQRQICACLARSGVPVEAITLDAPEAAWREKWAVPVTALGGRGQYGWTPRLTALLRQRESELGSVFIHGLWQWQGLGAWLALRRSRVPYFVFPHGMLDPWFREAFPLKHARKSLYWRLCEQRVLRDSAGVIFTSEEERTLGRATFSPWPVRHERIIPLGCAAPPQPSDELRERFFQRFPELRGKRLLLFLGRLHEKKGCDLLIEAFRQVGTPLHLVLAGPCDDTALESRLRKAAEGLPATFAGPLWDDDKWGALAAAEAFILPSHQENFGIAVVEALAAGTPVLISRKVNIWREIVESGAGLAEEDSAEGTARLLTRWLAADQAAMRAAAPRCHAERFDIRQTAAALVKLTSDTRP